MIGGLMLMAAVGAMILIAWWSLPRDDAADPTTGFFALRNWSERTVARKHDTVNRRNRRPAGKAKAAPGPEPALRPAAKPGKRTRRPEASAPRRRR